MADVKFRPITTLSYRDGQRFDRYTSSELTETGCIEWSGSLNKDGYGEISLSGKRKLSAHRLAYFMHHGTDPAEMCVLHTCDNPPCVRPSHLFLGTQKDNADDRTRKGRSASGDRSGRKTKPESFKPVCGEMNHYAKITNEIVFKIRDLFLNGVSQAEIQRITGITHAIVHKVCRRKSWAHLP